MLKDNLKTGFLYLLNPHKTNEMNGKKKPRISLPILDLFHFTLIQLFDCFFNPLLTIFKQLKNYFSGWRGSHVGSCL